MKHQVKKMLPTLTLVWFTGMAPATLVQAESPADSGTNPSKQTFSDGVRQGKLEAALLLNEQLSSFKIASEIAGNKAILQGQVSTPIEKDLAAEIAKGIDGIDTVDNRLVVATSAPRRDARDERSLSDRVRDATISAAVKADFLTTEMAELKIDVSTMLGVVTLDGEVATTADKAQAELIARNTEHVNDVKNRLRVKQGTADSLSPP